MSHFLQSLIHRHQDVGASQEVSHKVRPRAKSKFEIDTGPGFFAQNDLNNDSDYTTTARSDINSESYSNHFNHEARPIITTESDQSSRHTKDAAQLGIDNSATQLGFSRHIDSLKEQIKTATQSPDRKSSVQETKIRANKRENNKPTKDPREFPEITNLFLKEQQSQHDDVQRANEPQWETVSGIGNNAPSNEINRRIQTILHRLNSQQLQHTDGQNTNKSQHESTLDSDNNAPTSVAPLPLTTEPTSDFVHPAIKAKEQSAVSQTVQNETQPSDLLQTPNWLSEMQADLNNRMQEMNAKAEPEPVINVSIGRVEVKAVQAESIKQPKVRNKPKGVMGLDDYLKQRENRGRA